MMPMANFSVLDTTPIVRGSDAGQALRNSLDLARQAERLGYRRFWVTEHHNMVGIASSAPAIVINHVAAGTSTIRVGAAGVMLPNHAPFNVAEQFGTLEALHPGRIDLGLGRAPGSDQLASRALRRNLPGGADSFPQDVLELLAYLQPSQAGQQLRAVPGAGSNVPVWILGSSLFGAQLAAALGLPFAFASHFAPDMMMQAIQVYRSRFKPSEQLKAPYVALSFNVIAADTEEEARLLFTSLQQAVISLRKGNPIQLPPPAPGFERQIDAMEQGLIRQVLACSVVGDPGMVEQGLESFVARTGADEIMVATAIFDHAARVRSYELAAQASLNLSGRQLVDAG